VLEGPEKKNTPVNFLSLKKLTGNKSGRNIVRQDTLKEQIFV